MKILSVTLENKNLLTSYKEEGVNELIVALKANTFSALHEFEEEEIKEIVEVCHSYGMRITVLMNRLYGEADIESAQTTLDRLMQYGVDGVMFADPGLLKHAKENGYVSRMIYRPETLMTSTADAKVWKSLGLRSVVIPCLLTKGEVVEIANGVEDTTVIVHGATLMSVSKRKLLRAFQRVSNEEFDVSSKQLTLREKQREDHMPAYENAYGMMIYTDYIQESFEEMHDFMNAGVRYFEIDTAFMHEDSVMDAIKVYRKILNGEDASKLIDAYKEMYKNLHLSDGYYGQKTVK